MAIESKQATMVFDFAAQTITTIRPDRKTYSVMKFSDIGKALGQNKTEVKVDVKETGQHRTVNGFNAKEVLTTLEMTMQQGTGKMEMEVSTWVSPDVPGAAERKAFYERNSEGMFYSAMANSSGNSSLARGILEIQHKVVSMGGFPVEQIVRMKNAAAADPRVAEARKRMEEMKAKGGAQAAMAEKMAASMGGAAGGGFEVTMDYSDFSTASIPDSVFAIPAGFKQVDHN
jgi:hypothetical protein